MNSYVVNLYPIPNEFGPGEALNVTNTVAASFVTSFDPKTSCVLVSVQHSDLYVTFDGTVPSSSNGLYVKAPYLEYWSKEAARVARMIGTSGTATHVRLAQFTY